MRITAPSALSIYFTRGIFTKIRQIVFDRLFSFFDMKNKKGIGKYIYTYQLPRQSAWDVGFDLNSFLCRPKIFRNISTLPRNPNKDEKMKIRREERRGRYLFRKSPHAGKQKAKLNL